ncbi:DUF2959 family protein [Hyphococcus formosus]|uniref:DUF2959 family protein n=1 Tax=Hyphococcus formosus TaxID=3143534 RepID=UPI00398B7345
MPYQLMRALICALSGLTASCTTAYYESLERQGIEKRDILTERVAEARTEQARAQAVFTAALDEFRQLVDVDSAALEQQYDDMVAALDRSTTQAEDVRKRIKRVDDVGSRLFREWQSELKLYESKELRDRSAAQLAATRREYDRLMTAMESAADSMDPVLSIYRDQVLFLKHNLNARAISSLELERTQIETRVNTLIAQMNVAIKEADRFIETMND